MKKFTVLLFMAMGLTFSLKAQKHSVIIADSVYLIDAHTATIKSSIKKIKGFSIVETGICWSTSPEPKINDSKIVNRGLKNLITKLTGLTSYTTFFVRAYAVINSGVVYSNQLCFTTFPKSDNLQNGLLAYYPFSGNANDVTGNGNDVKIKGATLIKDRFGKPNSALLFNKGSVLIHFDGQKQDHPVITVTWWMMVTNENADPVFKTSLGNNCQILLRVIDHKYQLEFLVNNKKYIIYDKEGTNTIHPKYPRFDFMSLSYYNNELLLYINNNVFSAQINNPIKPIKNKKQIKCYINGAIDDIRVYERRFNSFLTGELMNDTITKPPVLANDSVIKVTEDSALVYSKVTSTGGSELIETGFLISKKPEPNASDTHVLDCCGSHDIRVNLKDLTPNTTYYAQAYANNYSGYGFGKVLTFKTPTDNKYGTVSDIDGNIYKTVKIGTQTWMAENLKTTKYANGTPLFDGDLLLPGYSYYERHDIPNFKDKYGLFYNWESATKGNMGDTYPSGIQGVCPGGWHIPNYAEQEALINFLGGRKVAGSKLKVGESDTISTNESGFSAFLIGEKGMVEITASGEYENFGLNTGFWNSESYKEETGEGLAPYSPALWLDIDLPSVSFQGSLTGTGLSVRCIKDTDISYIYKPVVTTLPVYDISGDFATSGGKITYDGGELRYRQIGICWSTSPTPDTSDFKMIEPADLDSFAITMFGLSANTKYYVRAFAANSKGIGYGNEISFSTKYDSLRGTVKDIEGNTYKTIRIGTQIWMAENLRSTKLNDSSPIEHVEDSDGWWYAGHGNSGPGAYSWYNHDSCNITYGALYNWLAVYTNKVCPVNWHVPTLNDWDVLETYLGGMEIAGGKLKSTDLWHQPNIGATNESGFSGLPAGYREDLGRFFAQGSELLIWTSTDKKHKVIDYSSSDISSEVGWGSTGYSVRCLRDSLYKGNQKTPVQFSDANFNNLDRTTNIVTEDYNSVEFYPNPANTVIYFKNLSSNVLITIYDSQSKKVMETFINNGQLDVSVLPSGIYIMKLKDKNNTVIRKLIKQDVNK